HTYDRYALLIDARNVVKKKIRCHLATCNPFQPALSCHPTASFIAQERREAPSMAKKRIGILTGGGRVAGLNCLLKTVTYRGSDDDIDVIGLRLGWEGLTHLDCNDPASMRRYVMPLDRANTRTIDRRGGTMLHASRTNPSNIQKLPAHLQGKDLPVAIKDQSGTAAATSAGTSNGSSAGPWDLSQQVLANLSGLGIDHLIAIGGVDTPCPTAHHPP